MSDFKSVLGFAVALAILGLAYGTAAADWHPDHPCFWIPVTVPNSDFSTNGSGGSSWSPTAGVESSENGTVLASWNFASHVGGTFSQAFPTTAQYPSNPEYDGTNEVARLSRDGGNKERTFCASNALPGVTIEVTRYRITAQVGGPLGPYNNAYKYGIGFLYGQSTDWASIADGFVLWGSGGGDNWVAPYEGNSGLNEPFYLDRPTENTVYTYSWVWDNTGTGAPAIPVGADPSEGYTPGYGIFTNQKHVGDPLRVSLTASFRNVLGAMDFDDIVLDRALMALEGDADLNNLVDISDFFILKTHFDQSPAAWADGDFNHDDLVDISDFFALKVNFDQSAGGMAGAEPTPEPASAAVLLAALPWLMRRRRGTHPPK